MAKQDRLATALYCDDPSLTQQHMAGECDINEIVRRAENGQIVTHVNNRTPVYQDVSNVPNYQEAFTIVKQAEEVFMSMPWQQRERFSNNPQQMLTFLNDPANKEEAIRLGLVMAPEVKVPVVDVPK